jgi:DNA primase
VPAADLARLRAAHAEAARFYRDQLTSPAGAGPHAYLLGRGGAAVLASDRWDVGYAPDGWTTLIDHLHALGFTDADLLGAGLAGRARTGRLIDVFRGRIVFGVHDLDGHLVGFIGRAAPRARTGQRYLNTAETPLYRKGEVLFGLWEQLPNSPPATNR